MLELEAGRGRFFDGPWHAWRREKAARELALGRAIERQQAEIERLERFVTRFRAGTRARQAQSRAKRLEKIERISRDPAGRRRARVRVQAARAQRARRVRARGRRDRGRRQAAADRRRAVARARRARLDRRRQRDRQDDADRDARRPAGARARQAADRPQRQARLSLTARRGAGPARWQAAAPVLEATQHATGLTPGKARALLGGFLFSGEDAEKPLDGLSGRRAAPAVARDPCPLGRQRPDPRRADQPPRSREPRGARGGAARVRGLAAARLARSRVAGRDRDADDRARGRDAAQLRRRLARVRAGARGAGGERGVGAWQREARPLGGDLEAQGAGGTASAPRRVPRPRATGSSSRSKSPRRRFSELEDELSDPAAWSTPEASARSTQRHEEARRAVAELYERWEAVAG